MKFSGSSGMRMQYSRELVDEIYRLGFSLGSKYGDIAVAGDFRKTTEPLMHVLMGAILAAGADVSFGGHVPTPSLAYATKNHDAGAMITASHNPPEYNGVKLWNRDGSAFSEGQMRELSVGKISTWKDVGRTVEEDMVGAHRNAILNDSKQLNIKIVVDCANGAGSVLTPFLLKDMGAEVITMNCHPSGLFPGHPSEPNKENLRALRDMVLRTGADLGIAHDGDADRFIAITSSGRYLSGDEILAIFTKYYGFRRIVAPVNSSMLLSEFAEVVPCKVGDANVSQMMKNRGVEFGGENSGTQIFASWRFTPDAIYAAVKFAEIAEREDIDAIVSEFPKFHTLRRSYRYEKRESVERKIKEIVKDYEAITVDGYRVNLDDSWFLIRFSGTEPKVRVTVESKSKDRGEKIMMEIEREIKEALK